jgi:hypothetical protein
LSFFLADEGTQEELSPLPDVGDFVVIDAVHTGRVTSRTFAYDLTNEGLCHIMINAERVIRLLLAVHSN